MVISLDENQGIHSYHTYGILNFLGDLGGLKNIMFMTGSFFIAPIASFSYTLKALEKLFVARTVDDTMFSETKNKKKVVV
jgi:hypothetical protein